MKLITAIIKPTTLESVRAALEESGVSGLTVSEVRGFGRQQGHTEVYRGAEYAVAFVEKLRLDVVVPDDMAESTLSVIADAARLFKRHPPESLPKWRSISRASALKTGRDVRRCAAQSLEDGHAFFQQQQRELQWAAKREQALKTMWANKAVILAVFIGLGAVYFRKSPIWANIAAWSIPGHYF